MIPKLKVILVASMIGSATSGQAEDVKVEADFHPYSVSAEIGTTSIGGAARWRFCNHFGVRAGMNYMKYSKSGEVEGVNYDGKLRLQTEPVTLDFYPWAKRSFYISLGVALNQNLFTGTGDSTGSIEIGDSTYTSAQIGTLSLRVEQQPVNPYLSIGGNFFYFDTAHHWALGGEMGVMYTGDADVTLTTSASVPGLAADLAKETEQLEDAMNKFKFLPVLKLSVTFAF